MRTKTKHATSAVKLMRDFQIDSFWAYARFPSGPLERTAVTLKIGRSVFKAAKGGMFTLLKFSVRLLSRFLRLHREVLMGNLANDA